MENSFIVCAVIPSFLALINPFQLLVFPLTWVSARGKLMPETTSLRIDPATQADTLYLVACELSISGKLRRRGAF